LYYMRVSPYGQILTDTVSIDTSAYDDYYALDVVGNGVTSWCIWPNSVSSDPEVWVHTYMMGRDMQGQVVLPMTDVAAGGAMGTQVNNDADLRIADSTIFQCAHSRYNVFTTTGDTLLWRREIEDAGQTPVDDRAGISPSGTPWTIHRRRTGAGSNTELMGTKYEHDTLQTHYFPFGQDVPYWDIFDFGIDSHYQVHLMLWSDTASVAYARLDSSFQLLEWHTLTRLGGYWATMRTDAAGNCLFIWDAVHGTRDSLYWAYRQADGNWLHPSQGVGGDAGALITFRS
jgi:hypothetical protein